LKKNRSTQDETQPHAEEQEKAEQAPTRSMISLYMDFLATEGFRPRMNEGEITFKYEGKSFLLHPDETDRTYFHLVLPNIYEIKSEEEDAEASDLMNDGNMKLKVVKIFKVDNSIWMSAECFMDRPESFASFFERACDYLASALSSFHRGMRERMDSGLPQSEPEQEEETPEEVEKAN